MKRVLLLWLACMMLLSAVASAEIKKDKDETGLYVASTIKKPEIGFEVKFTKNVVGNEHFYRMFVFVHSQFPEFLLGDSPITLSIDKYPSFDLDDYKYGITKGVGQYYSSIQAKVSLDMIERIKNAKKIMLLCKSKDGPLPYGMLSQDFLDEWKEVINTEA